MSFQKLTGTGTEGASEAHTRAAARGRRVLTVALGKSPREEDLIEVITLLVRL